MKDTPMARDLGPAPVTRTGGVVILAPVLFAVGFVLTVYADSGSALEALPRPIAVAAVAALALQAAATLLFRNVVLGAAAALVVLLGLVNPLLGMILALSGVAVSTFARWRGFSAMPLARWLGAVVAITFVIASARVVLSPAFSPGDLFRSGPPVAAAPASRQAPDIFLLMLDGYPRGDTLASWGYDNAWFSDALEDRGFAVAGASHTNYPLTALVLPTMFHMRHIHEIEALNDVPRQLDVQRRALRTALEAPPAIRRLSELGYASVSAGRPADYITLNTSHYVDAGWLNEFEHQILARTALSAITVPTILDARRGEVLETLRAPAILAEDPAPTFMFAHVMNPHLPFIFDRHGDQPATECHACTFATHIDHSGLTTDEFHRAYADQVHYVNGLILDSIDGILRSSPEAVVILFSDHGSRANREPDAEWFTTFFASRTPRHPGLFPDDARPIEIFPRLLGAYFGDDIPIPPDEDYLAPRGVQMPLDIIRRGTSAQD